MNKLLLILLIFLCPIFAFARPGGGGNQPGGGGNQPGGDGSSTSTVTFDTFIEDATTNNNVIVRSGTAWGWTGSTTSLSLDSSITNMIKGAFALCGTIESVDLSGSGLKNISDEAFDGCSALGSVALPTACTEIGKRAFANCPELMTVYNLASVTTIKKGAFIDSDGLVSMTFNLVVELKNWSFSSYNTNAFTSVYSNGTALDTTNTYASAFLGRFAPVIDEIVVENIKLACDELDAAREALGLDASLAYEEIATTNAANGRLSVAAAIAMGIDYADPDADFEISISMDSDGNPVVTTSPESAVQGKIIIQGCSELGGDWHEKTEGDSFFRAVLEL